LNRFTGDIQQSDQGLTALLVISISLLCDCLSGVLAIAISTSGYFLIVAAPIVFAFYRMQHFFRRTNIQIRRLGNVARSPIFTELTASLSCIVSLRSFSIVEKSFSRLEARLDEFMAITYMRFKVGAWLNIRLDSLGSLSSFFVAVFTIASTDYGATSLVSAGGMAVSLSYSFAIPTLLSFLMALVTEVEGMMSAIERIKDYTENVPQEEVDKSKYIDVNTQLSPEWPSCGQIVVKNIEMRYRDGPLVLNKVSFTIEDKEKVGIVGRTGSGKSSLLTSIFRFENLYSGQIFIDNVDISTIPLSVLRSRLCIIPQEPVLFCGTLRFNLDPFDEHTDLRLWEVIDIIGLKEMVSSLPKQLLYDIAEGGDNLSVGQRQLVCFGR
jgi:ABC-type multidrug transport system fused ATPase/permease subunit